MIPIRKFPKGKRIKYRLSDRDQLKKELHCKLELRCPSCHLWLDCMTKAPVNIGLEKSTGYVIP